VHVRTRLVGCEIVQHLDQGGCPHLQVCDACVGILGDEQQVGVLRRCVDAQSDKDKAVRAGSHDLVLVSGKHRPEVEGNDVAEYLAHEAHKTPAHSGGTAPESHRTSLFHIAKNG
jgi:hypothetical protein